MEKIKAEILFLGTGGSAGTPMIGCACSVCTSPDKRNIRLRPSILLRYGDLSFLIDAGPDFRQQALRFSIDRLSGVILTHAHFDHIGGLDDLRVYYLLMKRALPCLLSRETYNQLLLRTPHLFQLPQEGRSLTAQFSFHVVEKEFQKTVFESFPIETLHYTHGGMNILGLKIGSFAYVTDIREYTQTLVDTLHGIETLVVSAIGEKPSLVHFSVDEALYFAAKVKAKKVILTHFSHEIDHEKVKRDLPSNADLAYDGMLLSISL